MFLPRRCGRLQVGCSHDPSLAATPDVYILRISQDEWFFPITLEQKVDDSVRVRFNHLTLPKEAARCIDCLSIFDFQVVTNAFGARGLQILSPEALRAC